MLKAVLFPRSSFFALVIFRVMTAPVIFHVPRIVPGMPCDRVLAMNPICHSWQTKVPSLSIDIISFELPTVPCQPPTIFVAYSVSGTGGDLSAHDHKQHPARSTIIAVIPRMQFEIMKFALFNIYAFFITIIFIFMVQPYRHLFKNRSTLPCGHYAPSNWNAHGRRVPVYPSIPDDGNVDAIRPHISGLAEHPLCIPGTT